MRCFQASLTFVKSVLHLAKRNLQYMVHHEHLQKPSDVRRSSRKRVLDAPSFGLVNETLPQPVWILMGGDSSQRQASLASGLNAWMSLRHQADYQVCPKADFARLDSVLADVVLCWHLHG